MSSSVPLRSPHSLRLVREPSRSLARCLEALWLDLIDVYLSRVPGFSLVRIAYRLLYQRRANANKAATSTSSSSKTAPTTSTTTTTTTDTSVQQRLWTTFAQFFDSPEAMAGAIGTLAAVSVDNSLANSVFVFWFVSARQPTLHSIRSISMDWIVEYAR